jgi:hypothetical protein
MCYASPDDWTDRSGVLITSDSQASLLPDCNNSLTNAPCQLPTTSDKKVISLKALLRPGDPQNRG